MSGRALLPRPLAQQSWRGRAGHRHFSTSGSSLLWYLAYEMAGAGYEPLSSLSATPQQQALLANAAAFLAAVACTVTARLVTVVGDVQLAPAPRLNRLHATVARILAGLPRAYLRPFARLQLSTSEARVLDGAPAAQYLVNMVLLECWPDWRMPCESCSVPTGGWCDS